MHNDEQKSVVLERNFEGREGEKGEWTEWGIYNLYKMPPFEYRQLKELKN